VRLMSGQ